MPNTSIYAEIREIKKYALDHKVPIMVDEGIDFLTTFIIKNQTTNILEIGSAIGYSAIMMALANPNVKITTIERDHERYLEAVKNVKKLGLEDKITLIFNDALETTVEGKFDLIFIDAAKGQNIRFFEKFEPNLTDHGVIITDNIDFHGLVQKDVDSIQSRNLRGLIRKIREYIDYLKNNPKYEVEFLKIGDGIAVARRR
ncbi:MAG TPA: O-methyltransferase [Candidatus Scybalousia intestinigallinarum]|nr:O-methyltransferase [Candidatus Scybalousia intestinigallinarum]